MVKTAWEDRGDSGTDVRYLVFTKEEADSSTFEGSMVYGLLNGDADSKGVVVNPADEATAGYEIGFIIIDFTTIANGLTTGITNINYVTDIVFSGSVTELGSGIFQGSGVTTLNVTEGITTISSTVFGGSNINNITVDANNTNFSAENGYLYNQDKTKLILCPPNDDPTQSRATVTLNSATTTIGEEACAYINYVTGVDLTNITSIEANAFKSTSMRTITNILRRTDENGDDINNSSSTLAVDYGVFDGTLIQDTFDKAASITARVTGDETITYYDINDNLMEDPKDATNEEQTYPVIAKVVEEVSGAMGGNKIILTATKIFYETVAAVSNSAPIFTSPATFSVPENQTEIGIVTATDADGNTTSFTYSLSGADSELLVINQSTGELTFVNAPDYDTKNTYTATVTVSDGTNSATQDITVNVTNVNEPPTIDYEEFILVNPFQGTAKELETNKLKVVVTNDDDVKDDSFTYQWQIPSDNGANWGDINGETSATYVFKSIDVEKSFRAVVGFTYNDGTPGSETLDSIIYYAPPTWSSVEDDDKKATVGEAYSYKPSAVVGASEIYYLLESPGWLGFGSSSQGTNNSGIPYSSSSQLVGTPTVAGLYDVKIAVVDGGEIYRASVLEFTITVLPFKPATKTALQSAIDKWYVLANATAGGSTGTTSTSETTRTNSYKSNATGEVSEKSKFYIQNVTDPIELDIDGELTRYSYENKESITKQNLVKVVIGTKVKVINGGAFQDCEALKNAIIPDSVESIGDQAFQNCEELKNAIIPDSVTTIGPYVFNQCYKLESVTIGDGVETVSSGLFRNCQALESVTIGNNVKTIDGQAFVGCTALTSVTIGNSVETIVVQAFEECKALQSLTIPDSVKEIQDNAFLDSGLKTLYISKNNGLGLSEGEQNVGGKEKVTVIFTPLSVANNHEGPEYYGNPNTWDTSLITDLSYVFYKKDQTNHPDISTWDVSKVTSMQGTFSNSTFNGELKNWNVASVTDFSYTFANNVVFNQELKRWNVQDAITMESMFDNAYSFNQTIEQPMMQNKDGTDFPTQLTWNESTINGYLETIYGSATPQTDPTTFKGVFGMIALLKKTYLDNIPNDPAVVGKYSTIKSSFSEVISKLTTNQLEIKKYNSTYNGEEWKPTSPTIYFANTDGKTGDDLDDAKDKLNQLRLKTIVDGMLLINKAYDIAKKDLGETGYSTLINEMKSIYDNVYAELPFYVAWYAPLLETKTNFLNNALTMQSGKEGTIKQSLIDFIDTNPIKTINDKTYESANNLKSKIVELSSADLFDNFKAAYTS